MNFANRVIDECESTNDLARELALAGYPHGTWVSARRQGAGRGRLGRKWESVEGNLFLSIIARRPPPPLWSWLPLAVGVGAAASLRRLQPGLQEVRVKWPNDLWVDRKKLGGVLCEASGGKNDPFVIAGLGVNCAASPRGLDQPAVSISELLGIRLAADDVRAAVISGVLESLDELHGRGADELGRRYESLAALASGTRIEWSTGARDGEPSSGTVLGLGPSGELRVADAGGAERRLFAEDVKIR